MGINIVDVVIPSKTGINTDVLLENCIASLRRSEPNIKFNVCVVESGPAVFDKGQDFTLAYDKETFCYNHALNIGMEKGSAEWVILANSDLIFEKGFMSAIIDAHQKRPDILSFSPWNSMWNWHERIYGINLPDFKTYKIEMIEGYRIGHELTGWCIIVKREVFKRIVLSEEVNFWYSDNVYADALIEAQIPHALVIKSRVDHIVSQTKLVTPEEADESYREYLLFKERSK